ncbi:MAG: PAS domain-containing protein [Rhodobacteraceae bacterium]|nr:PAS domain-containing protein [Paracoccaceae bacterium]
MRKFLNRLNSGRDTRKVISMDRFRSGKSVSPIHQAEAYWNALRTDSTDSTNSPGFTGAVVPKRSQIDPRGLENILEYAFIIERIAPGIARFRLAGRHLRDLAGLEVRGMPLTCFFTPAGRTRISVVLEHMFDTPSVAELTLTSERKSGANLEARMILLPLRSDMGTVNRALGVLIADGPMAATPNRFDIDRTSLRAVSGPQGLLDQGQLHHPLGEKMTDPAVLSDTNAEAIDGFEEAQAGFAGKVPYLRVVK